MNEKKQLQPGAHYRACAILIMLLITGHGMRVCAQWLAGYHQRFSITIDGSLVTGDTLLTDFPMLIRYSDSLLRSASNGGIVSFEDGRDLCFAGPDSVTVLDFEFEEYDPVEGSLAAWVRLPSLSADTLSTIFLYYGDPEGEPQWDTAGVWNNRYTAVWHMNNDPSGQAPQILDATSFGNHGTAGGGMAGEDLVEGKVSGSIRFDGQFNFATMPVNGFNPDSGTVELWIRLDSLPESESEYIFAHRRPMPIEQRIYMRIWDTGEWGTGMGDSYDLARGAVLGTLEWYYLALSWDGTGVTGYLNGSRDFGPVPYSGLDTVAEIYLMSWMPMQEAVSGTLDEVRISDMPRDSTWIAASYQNQFQPEALYQIDVQPVNDLPCSAIELEATDSCVFGLYSSAGSTDSGIEDPACGSYEGSDTWFYVVVPPAGSLEIQTDTEAGDPFPLNDGWIYRGAMAVYSGHCDSLVKLGCFENNGTFNNRMSGAQINGLDPGDTLWVRIWGSGGETGMFRICCFTQGETFCPSQFQVEGGGGYCQGGEGVPVMLSGSETGYLYTLIRNDSVLLDTLTGTGDSLTWWPVQAPGTYIVLAFHPPDTCLRFMADSVEVSILQKPQLSFQVADVSCFDLEDGSIIPTISGGKMPYQVQWTGPGGFSSASPDISGLGPGEYAMTATDDNGCSVEGTSLGITEPELLIAGLESVGPLTSYDAGNGTVEIGVTGGTPPYSFAWKGTDGYESTDRDPSEMSVGYYDVRITDDHQCMDSILQIALTVEDPEDLFIPEGISPNGDGYNDRFVIVGIENYPVNKLVVFNRQGVEVYREENYGNEWDGTPNRGGILGGTLPEGTYYYVFTFGTSGVRRGFLYINKE